MLRGKAKHERGIKNVWNRRHSKFSYWKLTLEEEPGESEGMGPVSTWKKLMWDRKACNMCWTGLSHLNESSMKWGQRHNGGGRERGGLYVIGMILTPAFSYMGKRGGWDRITSKCAEIRLKGMWAKTGKLEGAFATIQSMRGTWPSWSSGDVEKPSDSGCMLKIRPTRVSEGWGVGSEKRSPRRF